MRSSKMKRFIFVFLLFAIIASAFMTAGAIEYKDDLRLKVGLEFGASSPSQTVYTSEDGFNIISYNEETYESEILLEINEPSITIKNIGGKAAVYDNNGAQLYLSETETLYFTGKNGSVGYDGKTYNEVIKIFCKDGLMRVINIIAFETYLKGVLPREIYPSWPEESLKSAAVAARTFALHSLGGKHSYYGVDVCTTSCCQVFGGNGSNEQPSTNAAVEATKNMVLAYDGKLAMTVYTSSAGYHTESSEGAWGGSQSKHPYLCGVPTPHETPEEYPRGKWSSVIPAEDILTYINSKSAYAGKLVDGIASIVLEHGETGYARRITVTDIHNNSVSAKNSDNVRGMLSKFVRSANYTISPNYHTNEPCSVSVLTADGTATATDVPNGAYILRADSDSPVPLTPATQYPLSFTVSGYGWGHGVGMSQFGAMTMAKNGSTYTEILAHYYPGTYLTSLSDLAAGRLPGEEPAEVPEDPAGNATPEPIPEQTTTEQTTTEQTTPEQTTSGQTTAEQTTPEQTTSEQTTAEQTNSEQTTPEQTTSEQTTSEQTTSEQTTSEQTTAEQTTAEQTTSEQTTAEQSVPEISQH